MFTYYFITVCDGKKYGVNCTEDCGSCLNLEQCHHVNGSCLNGCNAGYRSQDCTEGKRLIRMKALLTIGTYEL